MKRPSRSQTVLVIDDDAIVRLAEAVDAQSLEVGVGDVVGRGDHGAGIGALTRVCAIT